MTLLAVLCAAPWHYGGVELDTQAWLDRGLLTSLGLWIVASACAALAGSPSVNRLPTLLIPLVCALVLGAAQLCPRTMITQADEAVVDNLSTNATSPSARTLIPDRHPANSIYPAATRLEVARLGMAMIACYLGIVLFPDATSQLCLWGSFAANGAALAFFGIVQQLSWNGKLFWTVPLLLGGQPFASFVNRNNAAGYLNICLAAALGLTMWSFFRVTRRADGPHPDHQPFPGSSKTSRPSLINELSITSIVLAATIAAGIICSVSRGGVLALLVASFALLLYTFRTRLGVAVGALFASVLLLGVGLVLWTGQEERFLIRWTSSSSDTVQSGAQTRLSNWRDALHAAQDFPILGAGFGTYSFAYLPYESWAAPVRFYNADNQFVECAVEGGAVGISLSLIAIALWLTAAGYLIRFDQRTVCGVVSLFTIVSQTVSALFDFGPTMSANMLALSVFAGVTTARAAAVALQIDRSHHGSWFALPEFPRVASPIIVAAVLLGYGFIQFKEVAAASRCRVAVRDVPKRLDLPDAMAPGPLELAIQQITAALQSRPDDAEAHSALARLLIYRYRSQTYDALTDYHKRGGPSASWSVTDTLVLYDRTNNWRVNKQSASLDELRKLPEIRLNLVPAYRHLLAAQAAAPLMPELPIGIATLALILNDDETTARAALQRAVALNSARPDYIAWCGTLAQSAGFTDQAEDCRNRSRALDSTRAKHPGGRQSTTSNGANAAPRPTDTESGQRP